VVTPSGPLVDGVLPISDVVEKPPVDEAPSEFIIIGRYVLTPDVFGHIANLKPGAIGELQLTDALRVQAAAGPFHGVLSDVGRHDTGTPLGWLTAVVDIALDDPSVGAPFRAWLSDRV
jgi:UTP--glucose-1-phosphate uridylyltransferase